MTTHATKRFITGALVGAETLHVALPWERGARRQRMALRRGLRLRHA